MNLEKKSNEEIEEILGITKTKSATKISRSKLKLKTNFKKYKNGSQGTEGNTSRLRR